MRKQEVEYRFHARAENVFHVSIGARRVRAARAEENGMQSGGSQQFPRHGIGSHSHDGCVAAEGDRALRIDPGERRNRGTHASNHLPRFQLFQALFGIAEHAAIDGVVVLPELRRRGIETDLRARKLDGQTHSVDILHHAIFRMS